jgi:hypothetical protein
MEVAMAHDEDCENQEGMCARTYEYSRVRRRKKGLLSVGRKTPHKRVPMFSLQDFNIVVYLLLFNEGKRTRTGLGVASLIKASGLLRSLIFVFCAVNVSRTSERPSRTSALLKKC